MRVKKEKMAFLMAEKGYKFAELMELTGLSRGTLSGMYNGNTCRPDNIHKVAQVLGVSPEDLLDKDN